MPDSLRLALGTLTALTVPAPRSVDRRTAGRAMLLAPFVGTFLGVVAALVVAGVRIFTTEHRPTTAVDLLAAVLGIVVLALLTRGLHLDGLADTFDGFGVKGDDGEAARARRLEVMREPGVGSFGVLAMVLTLLVQVAALTECAVSGYGTVSMVLAATTGRLAATWCCTRWAPHTRARCGWWWRGAVRSRWGTRCSCNRRIIRRRACSGSSRAWCLRGRTCSSSRSFRGAVWWH